MQKAKANKATTEAKDALSRRGTKERRPPARSMRGETAYSSPLLSPNSLKYISRIAMSVAAKPSYPSNGAAYDQLANGQIYPKTASQCSKDCVKCADVDYALSHSEPNAKRTEHFQKIESTANNTYKAGHATSEKLSPLPTACRAMRKCSSIPAAAGATVSKSRRRCKHESGLGPKITVFVAFLNTLYRFATEAAKMRFRGGANASLKPSAKATPYRCFPPATGHPKRTQFRVLPSLGATSLCTLITLVCLETLLLSTVTSCAKTFYMHWNTSNSIFRIDNTDHIIDVNKGNLAFEFDQVHIICPVYEPGTYENETEKYIIYNVSKVEYETCRITNADPRVIAICDKPQKLMFFTITFRPFTPQPGGLEFLPGNDYYFISTSSKDDLYRRIGGRCSTNNMKVVFKVCCAAEDKNKNTSSTTTIGDTYMGSSGENNNVIKSTSNINQQSSHPHNGNTIGAINVNNNGNIQNGNVNLNNAGHSGSGGMLLKPMNGQSGTSINTNIDQFNRIPIKTNPNGAIMGGGIGLGNNGGNGILLTPGHNGINMIPTGSGIGIGQYPTHYPGHSGIRINNVATQHHPSQKSNNDDQYDKHPNEVVKNEELTYNSGSASLHKFHHLKFLEFSGLVTFMKSTCFAAGWQTVMQTRLGVILELFRSKFWYILMAASNTNPSVLVSFLLIILVHYLFRLTTNFANAVEFKEHVHCIASKQATTQNVSQSSWKGRKLSQNFQHKFKSSSLR